MVLFILDYCMCYMYIDAKLALLCGAPGLGKTTLAHIIARHAGYNVVEMNARYMYVGFCEMRKKYMFSINSVTPFVRTASFFHCSDDRSPEIFAQKIESSTQMQAVLTPDTKPNCLIIDEIDGAPTVSYSGNYCMYVHSVLVDY